jgi:hypothetical protein
MRYCASSAGHHAYTKQIQCYIHQTTCYLRQIERKKERKIIYFLNTAHNNEYYELTLYNIYEDKQTISSMCPKGKCAG